MDTQDFTDDEWRDMLDEFRLLVVRAGFADWDAAMALALDDFEGLDGRRFAVGIGGEAVVFDGLPVERLRIYARQFMTFLKSGARWSVDENRGRLARLLRTENDTPVEGVFVSFDDQRAPIDARAGDITAMVDEVSRFLSEIYGEDTAFWDDEPDAPEGR